MNKLASCLVTLGFASLTCAQAAPPRPAETPSPKRGQDLLSELRQLHGELRELRTLVEQIVKESTLPAYDLRIEGSYVTLAFTRALTLPEFLRLAQEVTNARYVYDSAQVATAGPVMFVGRIHCQRSEFPAFVDTMLYIHGLYAQARGSGDARYIEVGPMQPVKTDAKGGKDDRTRVSTLPGYDLRIEGSDVTLAFNRALTLPEFLRLAQEVTNARYVYDRDQVATAGPVTLMGRIHCQRSEFPAFVDTMLYIHGLQAQARGSGDAQYLEVGPVRKG